MMDFRFDHIGFLTADVDYAFSVYRALGCDLTERAYRRGVHDVSYGGAGTDVLLEFQGPPLLPESEEYLARLGGNIVWQVRLEDDMATQVCHKYAAHADPERHSEDIDRRTGALEAHYIDWPPATTYGANGLRGVYSRMGGLSPRGPGGFIVYRPEHWAFAGADIYYGDVLGADVPLVGYETDGVDYTFRQGLPYPTGTDGSPAGLEILGLTPVTLEEEDHGQAGNLISIADGDLSFAAEAIHGEDTPENRNKLRYGSAVITAMPKGRGEVFCAGTTEWCFALARGDRQVETITANVLDRFLDADP